jgi:Ca-activated chloride channel homolog
VPTVAYPWLLLLLPLPLAVWWLWPPYRESRTGLRVPFLDRLARAAGQEPTTGAVVARRGTWPMIGAALVWALLVGALARPQWLEPPIEKTVPTRDLLLAVDLSGSMETKDFTDAAGTKVDRLTAVKEVLDDFLKRRQGDRVGLIVFGNAPFVQAPFTDDLDVCRELLSETQVRMAGPKTAFGDAIGLAVNVFDKSDVPTKVLIVLTDGNDTGSQVPPDRAAEVARDRKITVYTVAVGDPRAAGEEKLDEETLKKVAETTGGLYSFAADRAALEAVYKKLDEIQTREVQTISYRPRRDLFQWPLLAAVLLSLLAQALSLAVGRGAS